MDNPPRKASIRAMIRSAVFSLTIAAALIGCQQDKEHPNWDKSSPKTIGASDSSKSAPSGSTEERLARVERKLDKITEFLKQAVPPKLDESATYAVPIDPADPQVGPADAKVTIVEAYEFMCPYCAMVAPTVDQLVAEYPKDVRVVSKYFVIHGEPAMPAGQGACAAQKQGKYNQYQQALWKKSWPQPGQPPNKDALAPEAVVALATELGMDAGKFKADMDGDCKEWLSRSMRTLQQFGANGTPSFYVNGRFTQAGNPAGFKRIIDEEIKKADDAIKGGVKQSDYYQNVVVGKGEKEAKMVSPFDE
jgi:protein-disulfide isomerase